MGREETKRAWRKDGGCWTDCKANAGKMQYGGGNTPEFSKVPLLYSCCAFVFHCMQRYHMDQRAVSVRRDLAQTSQSIVKR